VLDFDGVQALDVTGPIEVFTSANDFGGRYRLELVSADGRDGTAGTRSTGAMSDRDRSDEKGTGRAGKPPRGPLRHLR
jgi:hypothetical protein